MDRELIAYLDAKFDGVNRRFDGVDKRLDGVDKRLDGVDKRLDEVERLSRDTAVVVEDLRTKIQTVAEGHSLLSDRLDEIYEELKVERRTDRREQRAAFAQLHRRDDELEERIERLEATG